MNGKTGRVTQREALTLAIAALREKLRGLAFDASVEELRLTQKREWVRKATALRNRVKGAIEVLQELNND